LHGESEEGWQGGGGPRLPPLRRRGLQDRRILAQRRPRAARGAAPDEARAHARRHVDPEARDGGCGTRDGGEAQARTVQHQADGLDHPAADPEWQDPEECVWEYGC
ncbi:hypothetical protein LTR53_020098, partial [Teratosphaeriaceae sp. CCFEE 6253]